MSEDARSCHNSGCSNEIYTEYEDHYLIERVAEGDKPSEELIFCSVECLSDNEMDNNLRKTYDSLSNLAKENVSKRKLDKLSYTISRINECENLSEPLGWNSYICEGLTVEEMIGGLIQAEYLLDNIITIAMESRATEEGILAGDKGRIEDLYDLDPQYSEILSHNLDLSGYNRTKEHIEKLEESG